MSVQLRPQSRTLSRYRSPQYQYQLIRIPTGKSQAYEMGMKPDVGLTDLETGKSYYFLDLRFYYRLYVTGDPFLPLMSEV